MTVTESLAAFPAASVAVARISFVPSWRERRALKDPSGATGVASPSTTRCAPGSVEPITTMLGAFVVDRSTGDVIEIAAGVESRTMERVADAVLARESVATARIVFGPSDKATGVEKDPSGFTMTSIPFTVNATPGFVLPAAVTLDSLVRVSVGAVRTISGGAPLSTNRLAMMLNRTPSIDLQTAVPLPLESMTT